MTLIYISGVIVILTLSIIQICKEKTVFLSDILSTIVYSALSWTTAVFYIWNRFDAWLTKKNLDPILWVKSKD